MTLNELITDACHIGGLFSTMSIPIKKNGKEYNIEFRAAKDINDNWFIDVKED